MARDLTRQYFVTDQLALIFVERQASRSCTSDRQNFRPVTRPVLPFRSVNVRNRPGYDPGLQRHHLLPRQLLSKSRFRAMFDAIDREWPGLNDFRTNGMLLPCNAAAALQLGLPLHRGPHHEYNAMVIERVEEIETLWSSEQQGKPQAARHNAVDRLQRLQQDLRLRLLDAGRKRLELNRHDPLSNVVDFAEMDAMVDELWSGCDPWISEPAFLTDQPATFIPAIPLDNFTRVASPAWA